MELTKYINPLIKEFYLSENKEYVSNSEIILDFTSSAMYKFLVSFSNFVKNHPEYKLKNYVEELDDEMKNAGFEVTPDGWKYIELEQLSGASSKFILLLIMRYFRLDHFSGGRVIENYAKSGQLVGHLKRLREIDENDEDNIYIDSK